MDAAIRARDGRDVGNNDAGNDDDVGLFAYGWSGVPALPDHTEIPIGLRCDLAVFQHACNHSSIRIGTAGTTASDAHVEHERAPFERIGA